MDFDQETETIIQRELGRARDALVRGNEGMARVCCRRAAGAALATLSVFATQSNGAPSAMVLLELLSRSDEAPATVREAARRLRSKRLEDGMRAVSPDPAADAVVIISFARSREKMTPANLHRS